MASPRLSTQDIETLTDELETTIFDENELDLFTSLATGEGLYRYWTGRGDALIPTIRKLLDRLQGEGQLDEFLGVVHARRPKRKDIQKLIEEMAPRAAAVAAAPLVDFTLQKDGVRRLDDTTVITGLQRIVRNRIPAIDIDALAEFTRQARERICKLELNGGALGTGFLVGRAAVLTNWHVVEAVHKLGRLPAVTCRFDYAKRIDGSRDPGTLVALHANPLLCQRPYAPAEKTRQPDNPSPRPTELDYALLRTADPVGDTRGWFALPPVQPALDVGAPLIIVQHPDGAPMKVAFDTAAVLQLPPPPERPRIRYATNTENGSSGSPCFTIEFALAALHHLGDPAWEGGSPEFNQGVPINLVRNDIVAGGFGEALGA